MLLLFYDYEHVVRNVKNGQLNAPKKIANRVYDSYRLFRFGHWRNSKFPKLPTSSRKPVGFGEIPTEIIEILISNL